MHSYSLLAAAKINLYLEVVGDRPDGYHELVMVMQSIGLADRLTIRSLNSADIRLQCDHPQVPGDASNLAHRAAALLQNRFPQAMKQHGGVEITIQKNIPVGAGLAGGSADAAAVLVGVDMLWQLGAELGSDVPFCISGGTAIATGRGEQIDSLQGIEQFYVVLAKYSSLTISTPWAYQAYRRAFAATYVDVNTEGQTRHEALHSGPMVAAIYHQDGPDIGHHLHNDLEKVVLTQHAQVQALKDAMAASGGLGTLMSGSGTTVFTLAATRTEAEAIAAQVRSQLSDPDLELWVAPFVSTSVQFSP